VRYLNIDHLGHIDCCRRDAVANSYEPHRAQPAAASLPASQASQQTQASREPASQQSESEEEDEDTGVIAPQVKIGPNGEIVIDQDSLVQRSVDLTPTIEYEIYLVVVPTTCISTLSIIPISCCRTRALVIAETQKRKSSYAKGPPPTRWTPEGVLHTNQSFVVCLR
jgi:hypothetical protein